MTSQIKTVGVCGAAGTMGAGIAIVAARAGFKTICFDTGEETVGQGPQTNRRVSSANRLNAAR